MTRSAALAAAADLAAVAGFAVVGRRAHEEGSLLLGTATVAAPFATGAAAGWLAARGWRRPTAPVRTGVPVWVGAVTLGMGLRAATDQGMAPSFVLVASTVLGALLVGWRAVTAVLTARRSIDP